MADLTNLEKGLIAATCLLAVALCVLGYFYTKRKTDSQSCEEIRKSLDGLPKNVSTRRILVPGIGNNSAKDGLVFSFEADPLSVAFLMSAAQQQTTSDKEVKYYSLTIIKSDIDTGIKTIAGSQSIMRDTSASQYNDITVISTDTDRSGNYTLVGQVNSISFGGVVVEGEEDFPNSDTGALDLPCNDTPSCASVDLICNSESKTCKNLTEAGGDCTNSFDCQEPNVCASSTGTCVPPSVDSRTGEIDNVATLEHYDYEYDVQFNSPLQTSPSSVFTSLTSRNIQTLSSSAGGITANGFQLFVRSSSLVRQFENNVKFHNESLPPVTYGDADNAFIFSPVSTVGVNESLLGKVLYRNFNNETQDYNDVFIEAVGNLHTNATTVVARGVGSWKKDSASQRKAGIWTFQVDAGSPNALTVRYWTSNFPTFNVFNNNVTHKDVYFNFASAVNYLVPQSTSLISYELTNDQINKNCMVFATTSDTDDSANRIVTFLNENTFVTEKQLANASKAVMIDMVRSNLFDQVSIYWQEEDTADTTLRHFTIDVTDNFLSFAASTTENTITPTTITTTPIAMKPLAIGVDHVNHRVLMFVLGTGIGSSFSLEANLVNHDLDAIDTSFSPATVELVDSSLADSIDILSVEMLANEEAFLVFYAVTSGDNILTKSVVLNYDFANTTLEFIKPNNSDLVYQTTTSQNGNRPFSSPLVSPGVQNSHVFTNMMNSESHIVLATEKHTVTYATSEG